MKPQNQLESDSDWDSPTENNVGSPAHTDDGESLPTDRSSHLRPKAMKRGLRSGSTERMDFETNNSAVSGRSDRDALHDILAEAKIDGYQPDGSMPPPHDFRNALQMDDSIADDIKIDVRQPRKSPKEIRYEADRASPKSEDNSETLSKPNNTRKKKKKRISFDLSQNNFQQREARRTDEIDYIQQSAYKLPPTDFDNYDSMPLVKMEPIAERGESGMRYAYREAMTALGLVLSVFMIFIEEFARIIALKIFSPLLHMIRYFLMAIVQLVLDVAEFTMIGLKRVVTPLMEIIDLFVSRCCLPIIKALKPIDIALVSNAPLPHKIERGAYFNA